MDPIEQGFLNCVTPNNEDHSKVPQNLRASFHDIQESNIEIGIKINDSVRLDWKKVG